MDQFSTFVISLPLLPSSSWLLFGVARGSVSRLETKNWNTSRSFDLTSLLSLPILGIILVKIQNLIFSLVNLISHSPWFLVQYVFLSFTPSSFLLILINQHPLPLSRCVVTFLIRTLITRLTNALLKHIVFKELKMVNIALITAKKLESLQVRDNHRRFLFFGTPKNT